MAEFHELTPAQQDKITSKHPEFSSYTPGRQALVVKDRLKKDARNVGIAAPKAAAATEAGYSLGNVSTRATKTLDNSPVDTTGWVSPVLGHHAELDKASESLRNKLDTIKGRDTAAVHAHLDKADKALEDHMSTHTTGQAPLSAAYLESASKHITNAYRAMDVIHSNLGKPQGGAVEAWAKNISNNYKTNFAPDSKMAEPIPLKMETGAVATQPRNRKAEGERTVAKAETKAALEERRSPTPEELTARATRGKAAAAEFTGAMPESTGAPRLTGTPLAERSKMRAESYKKIVQREHTGGAAPESLVSASGDIREGARDIVKHHAVVATQALRAGVKVPAKSQTVLGPKGMTAVTAAHRDWLANQTEDAPEPAATSESLRAAHLQAFASGRGM